MFEKKKVKNVFGLFLLFGSLIVFGCSASENVDPDEYIEEAYSNSEQLAEVEKNGYQMRLMTYDEQYELVRFKKDNSSYQYKGSYISSKPYGQEYINDNGEAYLLVFVDNTLVNADAFTLEVKADDTDSIVLKAENLLENDPYLIKAYRLDSEYKIMETITFYDENGDAIEQSQLVTGAERDSISNEGR